MTRATRSCWGAAGLARGVPFPERTATPRDRRFVLGALVASLALMVATVSPTDTTASTVTASPTFLTRLGHALRVGPQGAQHYVALLAHGAGALAIVVASSGEFLAFACGSAASTDAWYSGDWYRGLLPDRGVVEVSGPDGERLAVGRSPEGRPEGTLTSADDEVQVWSSGHAAPEDGLFRREDADGVLGVVALPGLAACGVKRSIGGSHFVQTSTVPY